MTIRKPIIGLSLYVASACAAAGQSLPQPIPAAATRVEVPSAGQVPSDAYNKVLARSSDDHCALKSCDAAPALLKAQAPVYPADALAAGIEGRAAVMFDIDVRGLPQNITVQSATAEAFGAAALDAVRNWQFRPAMLGGRPVNYERALQVFPFELRD